MASEEIWLIWVRDPERAESIPVVVRRSLGGAKAWCDENRKMDEGAPIQWTEGGSGWHRGTSADVRYADAGDVRVVRQYALQPMELED